MELIDALETPDSDPVIYTEEMAAEEDELLANVSVPSEPWRDFMFTLVPLKGESKISTVTICAQAKKLTRKTLEQVSALASEDHGEEMAVVGIYELDIPDES